MKFKDKTVLITGSSRGIGRAIAIAFAQEGANIVINYVKNRKAGEEVVEEIKKIGSDAIAIQADVSNESDVKRMMEKTERHFGGIDILVNNAGIVFDIPDLKKTYKQWEQTLKVNLIGMFLCIKYAVPYLKKKKGTSIVNISSTNGISSLDPESMDYDASKAGVISLTKNFSQSLAPYIRVNSVAPGWVNTEINKDLPKKFIGEETRKIALKRFARPEEIAKVVLFLCSDDSSFITGSIITVDGGYVG